MWLGHLPRRELSAPDLRSPFRYLFWLGRESWRSQLFAIAMGLVWMGSQVALPALVGGGVSAVQHRNSTDIWLAGLGVLASGALMVVGGTFMHRGAVANWICAATLTRQLVARKAASLGGSLQRQVATGEVVAVSSSDVEKIGWFVEVLPRLIASLLTFVAVFFVLLISAPELGFIAAVGVPVLAISIWPLLGPLERRVTAQRAKFGRATDLAADTVAGLRVLRGIGGEELFLGRFRTASQEVKDAAVITARMRSTLEAMQVLLPGILVVAVTWIGARLVIEGHISVGQLVTAYGLSAVLAMPLRTITETAHAWTVARVSAGRIIRVCSLRRPDDGADSSARIEREEAVSADLVDPVTGITAKGGELTAVVCGDPDIAGRLAARLGGHAATDVPQSVRLGNIELDSLPLDAARSTVLVQDKDPVLMSGTVRDLFDIPRSGEVSTAAAITAAQAEDVLSTLADRDSDDPMDALITERGRSLSGGQRQRLALARSIAVDPPVLVLDEPTSAVDAHTEARIAGQLHQVRDGKTTVVFTTSPLLLDRADSVALVQDDRVVATGTHRQLLRHTPLYRSVVTRGEDA